jgi:hypothetical protein
VTLEILTLDPGERGEIVLCPEGDSRDPLVVLEGTDDFAVEDVMLGNLPASSVDLGVAGRGSWSARLRESLACPERPLKVLVRNTATCKITLRAKIAEEND